MGAVVGAAVGAGIAIGAYAFGGGSEYVKYTTINTVIKLEGKK